MKSRLKNFLLKVVANNNYDILTKKRRILRLVIDILSASIYTAYAIYVLVTKGSGTASMCFLLGIVFSYIVLIISLTALNRANASYSRKNFKIISKLLRNIIKILSLLPPILILAHNKQGGTVITVLNFYAILHISLSVFRFLLNILKLELSLVGNKRNYKKSLKTKNRINTNEKIYGYAQKAAKARLEKENYDIKETGQYQIKPEDYYKKEENEIEIIDPPK